MERDRLRGEHMGVVFQQFNLLPYLDVETNALMPTRLFASRAKASATQWGSPMKQAQALADRLRLPAHVWHQPVHQLSVGQQQRVAAVRALMGAPQLLIADEPTSALDRTVQRQVVELLRNLQAKYNLTYLFISHDLAVVKALSHQLMVVKQGQVVALDRTSQLLA